MKNLKLLQIKTKPPWNPVEIFQYDLMTNMRKDSREIAMRLLDGNTGIETHALTHIVAFLDQFILSLHPETLQCDSNHQASFDSLIDSLRKLCCTLAATRPGMNCHLLRPVPECNRTEYVC